MVSQERGHKSSSWGKKNKVSDDIKNGPSGSVKPLQVASTDPKLSVG